MNELQLLGQAQVLGEEVEASEPVSEVHEEEGSKKLSEITVSQELPPKMMGRNKMSQHGRQTSGNK